MRYRRPAIQQGILCVVAIFFMAGLICAPEIHAAKLNVVVLTDAAGLGDRGFNDVCWQGVERAKREFAIETTFGQSLSAADYVADLTAAAGDADIVVTLGFLFVDAVKKVVPRFPHTRFIHIEGDIPGKNVVCFDFKSEEGGYMAGIVAGLFTKTGKIGVIGGMDIPPVEAYISGFRAGVRTSEQKGHTPIDVIAVSAGSFDDPEKGTSLARELIEKGVDIIFSLAGNTSTGVADAVKASKHVYWIAEDLDKDAVIPGRVLTSALKKMDVAVYRAIRDIVQGEFQAGHFWLGASDGAIDITDMTLSKGLFTAGDIKRIERVRRLLKKGAVAVPGRSSQLADFVPPDL